MKERPFQPRALITRTLLMAVVVGGAILMGALSAAYAVSPVNTQGADKLAVHGYDAVAYFTDGKAVKGMSEFAQEYAGALYLFSSAGNRDQFAADPGKYAPQYGGYCAYAVAKGGTADIDPEAWTVKDGKLYLNYSLAVRATWLKDAAGYIQKADANWPKILAR